MSSLRRLALNPPWGESISSRVLLWGGSVNMHNLSTYARALMHFQKAKNLSLVCRVNALALRWDLRLGCIGPCCYLFHSLQLSCSLKRYTEANMDLLMVFYLLIVLCICVGRLIQIGSLCQRVF